MRTNKNELQSSFANPISWGIFVLYAFVLGFAIVHHELWGDELHSWNIAKASNSFSQLISNSKYEGHPPLWYILLWMVSKFTHDVRYIQLVQFMIAIAVVFLVLFSSPFSLLTKTLIPFGYFFLFEYGVFSRNYAIAVLLVFLICIVLHKSFKPKLFLYYALLFLLSNVHLLALLLALSLHLYFLFNNGKEKNKKALLLHTAIGIIILLPSLYFIFPPPDSSLGFEYWLQRWDAGRLSVIVKGPVRAFIPIPAWWNYHFWNTEFLLEAQYQWNFLKWFILLLSIGLVALLLSILKKNKNCLIFFLTYLLLIFSVSTILPFANARQTGFIFIGFMAAFWLYSYHNAVTPFRQKVITGLLAIQLVGGMFAIIKDIQLPFSNAVYARDMNKRLPLQSKIVTDYECLNTLSAFLDRSFYCVDLQKQASYLLWNKDLTAKIRAPNPYSTGIQKYFQQENVQEVYMMSIISPENLFAKDPQLFTVYKVDLVDEKVGAIEKSSNLYLYRVVQ